MKRFAIFATVFVGGAIVGRLIPGQYQIHISSPGSSREKIMIDHLTGRTWYLYRDNWYRMDRN